MNITQIKQRVLETIDQNREEIIRIANQLVRMPELGYREFKTSAAVYNLFEELGLEELQKGLVRTGLRGQMSGRAHRGKVAVVGELDALPCPGHPLADPETGAAHACGHYMQLTTMLGAAIGLKPVMDLLDGDAVFMAVPAEESVAPEFMQMLIEDEGFMFTGGKQEFIRRGVMDDIDAVLMVHTAPSGDHTEYVIPCGSNSSISKTVALTGLGAHAGGDSHRGINALNAAILIIQALHALRERFDPAEEIRVNAIIREGGEAVNNIPARAVIEICTRGKTSAGVIRINEQIDRVVHGVSYAMDVQYETRDLPGYMTMHSAGAPMIDIVSKNAEALVGAEYVSVVAHPNITTDTGDFSNVLPAIQVSVGGGFAGMHHRDDFVAMDDERAYILPTKLLALSVVDMLADGAKGLDAVKEGYDYPFTKESYLEHWMGKKKGGMA